MFALFQHGRHNLSSNISPSIAIARSRTVYCKQLLLYFIVPVHNKSNVMHTNSVRQQAMHQTDHEGSKQEVILFNGGS